MNILTKKSVLLSITASLFVALSIQAIVPTPAKPQQKAIAITGVTAHTGNGDVIENAVITFNKGKITSLSSVDNAISLEGHEVLNMQGKHLYPGFILPMTNLGLIEISALRATDDQNEQGEINPNVRALSAYNTDSELIPTLRFNGILTAQITPLGGLISGTSSIVKLDGWNWEDAAYSIDDGIHINWPLLYNRRYDHKTLTVKIEKNKHYSNEVTAPP